jgi:uncharacterized protein YggT (Ycf19 family)
MARRRFWRRDDRALVDDDGDRVAYDERPVRAEREYVDERPARVEREYVDESSAEDAYVERRRTAIHTGSLRGMLDSLVMLALLLLEVLLAVRFILIAFNARRSGFVDFILDISSPVVRPFRDTFTPRAWDQGVLDYNILLAMGVWFIAGIALVMLINVIVPDTSDDYRVDHRRRVTHG